MIHYLDPIGLHHAARCAGEAVAQGETTMDVAKSICRLAADAAPHKQGYKGNVSGLYVRLCWAAADAEASLRRRRSNAETALRWAVRPLMLRCAPVHEIEEAAGQAAAHVLQWDEISKILRDEVARLKHRREA